MQGGGKGCNFDNERKEYRYRSVCPIKIVLDDMRVKHEGILPKIILFSGRENPFLADFAAGVLKLKQNLEGVAVAGKILPRH